MQLSSEDDTFERDQKDDKDIANVMKNALLPKIEQVLMDAFALKINEAKDPKQKLRLRRASLRHCDNYNKWGNTVKVL